MTLVAIRRLPRHVAIIMDGNGRWAVQIGMNRPDGHREGSSAVRRIVRACRRLGVRALTLYAFSEQNWDRPAFEVDALMTLLRDFLVSERREILDHEIRLRAVGRLDRLPPSVREVLDPLVEESQSNRGMSLVLALSYGGREELADAARAIASRVARGELAVEAVTEGEVSNSLPSMEDGPVDLLIRTGGEKRISNFLLWGAAYAELVFSSVLWPSFDEAELYRAIAEYQSRERRFGLTSAQLDAIAAGDPGLVHA